jgi:hypothetical protein
MSVDKENSLKIKLQTLSYSFNAFIFCWSISFCFKRMKWFYFPFWNSWFKSKFSLFAFSMLTSSHLIGDEVQFISILVFFMISFLFTISSSRSQITLE